MLFQIWFVSPWLVVTDGAVEDTEPAHLLSVLFPHCLPCANPEKFVYRYLCAAALMFEILRTQIPYQDSNHETSTNLFSKDNAKFPDACQPVERQPFQTFTPWCLLFKTLHDINI